MSDQTPAERIAAARHQGLAFSWNDLSLVAKANETARAQRDLDALAEGDYVIVLCPKGERVVLDRMGDTDRLADLGEVLTKIRAAMQKSASYAEGDSDDYSVAGAVAHGEATSLRWVLDLFEDGPA